MKKLSYYNFYFKTPHNSNVIYNTLSDKVLEIDPTQQIEQQLCDNGMLVNHDVDELALYEYDSMRHRYCNKTFWLTIAPTLECNFSCHYCYQAVHPKIKMNLKTANRLIDFVSENLHNFKELFVCWFGGEPTLALDVIGYLSHHLTHLSKSSNKKYTAHCVTNGFLLDKATCQYLKDLSVSRLQITLDGHKEHHNKTRFTTDNHDTYHKILKNIGIAQNYFNNILLRVNTHSENVDTIDNIIKDLTSYGIDTGVVKPYLGQITVSDETGKGFTDYCLENKVFAQKVFQFEMAAKAAGYLDKTTMRCLTAHRYHYCMADIMNSMVVDPQGNISRCIDDLDKPHLYTGNIFDGKLVSNPVQVSYLVDTPFKDPSCRKCKYIPLCAGACRKRRKMHYKYRCDTPTHTLPQIVATKLDLEHVEKVKPDDIPKIAPYLSD